MRFLLGIAEIAVNELLAAGATSGPAAVTGIEVDAALGGQCTLLGLLPGGEFAPKSAGRLGVGLDLFAGESG